MMRRWPWWHGFSVPTSTLVDLNPCHAAVRHVILHLPVRPGALGVQRYELCA